MLKTLLALTLLTSAADAATYGPEDTRTIIINEDMGGRIADYAARYVIYNKLEVRVMVLGGCWSACTYVLNVRNVCAGPNAWFHFHQAHRPDGRRLEPATVKYLTNLYPPRTRALFPKKGLPIYGWLSIKGTALLPPC